MKVVKFGGSSLADGASYEHAIKIITSDPERRVVVTSAPGKRNADDIKVTDLLIKYAHAIIKNDDQEAMVVRKTILDRYQAIADYFDLPSGQMQPLVERLANLPNGNYPNNNYLLAAFKAHGERLNAELMSLVLNRLGHPARFITPEEVGLKVAGTPNNATVIPETYARLANFSFSKHDIIVFISSESSNNSVKEINTVNGFFIFLIIIAGVVVLAIIVCIMILYKNNKERKQ